jgi:hypothetical protein
VLRDRMLFVYVTNKATEYWVLDRNKSADNVHADLEEVRKIM